MSRQVELGLDDLLVGRLALFSHGLQCPGCHLDHGTVLIQGQHRQRAAGIADPLQAAELARRQFLAQQDRGTEAICTLGYAHQRSSLSNGKSRIETKERRPGVGWSGVIRSGRATAIGQPGDERGVFRRAAAQFDHGAKRRVSPFKSAAGSSQRPGNTVERYNPSSPIGCGTSITLFLTEPEDFVRFDRADNVFLHPGPLVIGLLRPQVRVPCRLGNLDNQLRGAVDVAFFVMAPAAEFGEEPEQRIRLWLALPAEDGRGVDQDLTPGVFSA